MGLSTRIKRFVTSNKLYHFDTIQTKMVNLTPETYLTNFNTKDTLFFEEIEINEEQKEFRNKYNALVMLCIIRDLDNI